MLAALDKYDKFVPLVALRYCVVYHPWDVAKTTPVSFAQSANAFGPMSFTLDGIVMDEREEHHLKADAEIVSTLYPRCTVVN